MSRSPLVRLATAIAGAAVAVGSAPPVAADTVTDPAPDPGASTVVAGTGEPGATGDGGDATEAQVENATGVAVDGDGAVYIADANDHRVRRVAPDGTISTFAGNGEKGNSGDGGAAGDARLSDPGDVAVDNDGVIYIADTGNNRIRRVAPNGTIDTLAGSAQEQQAGGVGDNVPATRAALHRPRAVAADPTGNVYIGQANRVRMVDQSGTISTVAGNAAAAGSAEGPDTFSGEDGPAVEAAFTGLNGIDVADDGALAILTGDRLLQVDDDGVITTLTEAGDTSGDAGLVFGDNGDVALDSDGTPYLVGGNAGAVRVDPQDGATAVVGSGQALGAAVGGDDNLYTAAGATVMMHGQPAAPRAPAGSGEATVGEDDAAVRAGGDGAPPDEDPGTITTAVEGGDGDALNLGERPGLSVDTTGHLYVAGDDPTVRVVAPDGAASPFAGGAISRFGGGAADEGLTEAQVHDVSAVVDDGLCLATSAGVVTAHPDGTAVPVAGDDPSTRDDASSDPPLPESPYQLQAVGADGTVYLAERGGARVHAVDREGAFRVVAGTGKAGLSGDGGPAVDAEFDSVSAIAVGPDDTLYVADGNNDRIRRVDSEGTVTTVVDAAGADVPFRPSDLAVDADGILYVSDADNNRVYRADPDGAVNALAGGGSSGASGDGGPALDAELAEPGGLALDGAGNLYVADSGNDRIRVIAAAAEAPTEDVGVSAGGFPWGPVLWVALGVVVLGLGTLVLWRPGEVAISVVAWGIAGYTLLRERIERIRGRGGARRPEASAEPGGAAEAEPEPGHDRTS